MTTIAKNGAGDGFGRSPQELELLLNEAAKVRGNSLWKDAMRRFKKMRLARFSMWALLALVAICFFTPLLPIAPPARVDLPQQYRAPALQSPGPGGAESFLFRSGWSLDEYDLESFAVHDRFLLKLRAEIFGGYEVVPLLGTDSKGRCLLSRILWGGRLSLMVGLVATIVSLLIGVTYGALSGYLGGRIDNLMMRIVDVLYSVPFIFVVIFIITIIRSNQAWFESYGIGRRVVFFAVIGAVYWLTMARVVRGQVLSLKHKEFIEASQVLGAGTARILFRHLIPNVFSVVLVYLTLTIPRVMLFEAFLSFLGLGVEAPDVSWGLLANDGIEAINGLRVYWWFVLFPGLALGGTLFALNFLGDGLRDALDPRLEEKS
ncbi:MAG: peptide ABC transporter permease [Planctomycetota bacterium]|nr:MAG: peptide ABC transporter permease [Planctomycetota bacterium]